MRVAELISRYRVLARKEGLKVEKRNTSTDIKIELDIQVHRSWS